MNTTQGKEEVQEAVLIAALSAIVTGLVNWTMEHYKERARARKAEETYACQDMFYPPSEVARLRRIPRRQPRERE